MALEVLLGRGGIAGSVSRSGYFFPGRKGEGQRMPMALDPAETRDILMRLLDLLRAGTFPHATDKDGLPLLRLRDRLRRRPSTPRGALEGQAREVRTLPVLRAFREIHGEG